MEVKVEPRLWRPAAQRNIRNALGYIQAQYSVWCKTSAAARAVATNLVNAYLSHSDVDVMDLGVLGGVNGIRGRAKAKLLAQQELCLEQFLRHYDALVNSVAEMRGIAGSLRTYARNPERGQLIQFSTTPVFSTDSGDGGGVAVFSVLPVRVFGIYLINLRKTTSIFPCFQMILSDGLSEGEDYARIVVALQAVEGFFDCSKVACLCRGFCERTGCDVSKGAQNQGTLRLPKLCLSIFQGCAQLQEWLLAVAFHNMVFQRTKLKNSREEQSVWPWRTISTKAPPLLWDKDDDLDDCTVTEGTAHPSSRETLQVYLTALLAEVNVNKWRVEEILRQWDDEMTSQ